tara:strand:+ start:167 stop:436 length:270 start_codon:yes stop_codon:yes gene_type:complete
VLEEQQCRHWLTRTACGVQGGLGLGIGDVYGGLGVEQQAHTRAQASRRRTVQAREARCVLEVRGGCARQQGLDTFGVAVLEAQHQGGAA